MNGYQRRRHGPLGGLVLVLLGVLFLIHGFRPDIQAWHILARWWPLLLIFWGVVRLIENLTARGSGEPARTVITGGEIFLILLLICAAAVVTEVIPNIPDITMDDSDIPFGEHAEVTEELPAQPVKAGAEILIQAQHGDITVDGTDDAEIRVVAKKSGFAMDEATAQKRARAVSVRLVQTEHGYEVSPQTSDSNEQHNRVDLEVHVPKKTSLTVKTDRGDVHVSDISGDVSAISRNGTLEVRNAGGDVHAEISRGDVRVLTAKGNVHLTGKGTEVEIDDVSGGASMEGEFYGPIRARNVAKGINFVSSRTSLNVGALPGKMEMDSGDLSMDDASGNIQLTTSEKDVVLENVRGRLRVEDKRGEVTVRLPQVPKEDITLDTESGGVELALPSSSDFEVDALSRSGEISTDFDDPGLKVADDGHGNATLRGKRGAKGPRIELHTSYGQIRLRKSD